MPTNIPPATEKRQGDSLALCGVLSVLFALAALLFWGLLIRGGPDAGRRGVMGVPAGGGLGEMAAMAGEPPTRRPARP